MQREAYWLKEQKYIQDVAKQLIGVLEEWTIILYFIHKKRFFG